MDWLRYRGWNNRLCSLFLKLVEAPNRLGEQEGNVTVDVAGAFSISKRTSYGDA